MVFLAKYNTQTTFYFPMVKRGAIDLAASADWTPASGDTKISKDGGDFANTTNNPAVVGGTGSVGWKLTLTATELQASDVIVQIVDSATKAVEDQYLIIYTYGNGSAKIVPNLGDAVRMGLTALPNAAADAAGGLPISDAGGLDLDTYIKRIEAAITSTVINRIDENISAAKVLAASQPNYAPAKAGDKMDIVDAPNATGLNALADALLKRDWTAITGTPPARCALNALRAIRNKFTAATGAAGYKVKKEDDSTDAWTGVLTVDVDGNITAMDPD